MLTKQQAEYEIIKRDLQPEKLLETLCHLHNLLVKSKRDKFWFSVKELKLIINSIKKMKGMPV